MLLFFIHRVPTGICVLDELWYLSGGISAANCVAAYAPKGAASLAESYTNIANPGTYDCTAPVAAPTWNATDGWIFNGSTQFLSTGYVPGTTQAKSLIVKYTDYTSGDDTVAGLYEDDGGGLRHFAVALLNETVMYRNGTDAVPQDVLKTYERTLAVAGTVGYLDGVAYSTPLPASTVAPTSPVYIGANAYNSAAASNFFDGNVQYVAIYNTALTANQVKAVVNAINGSMADQSTLEQAYVDLGFGVIIHWNMPTFLANDVAAGDLDPDTFAPTNLDIDQWCSTIAASGAKYAILTVKHHDGFCLWPTAWYEPAHSPYSIAQTAWYAANGSPDVVDLFVTACRANGLLPCFYYSIYDKTHEGRSGTTEITDAAAYIDMIKTHLTELLTNYGDITAMWFDGWYWQFANRYKYIPFETIYNHVKALQSNCLFLDNNHTFPGYYGKIAVKEQGDAAIPAGNTYIGDFVETIRVDDKWYYDAAQGQLAVDFIAAADILTAINANNALNFTYTLGISPGTDGHIGTAQAAIIAAIGYT